MSDLTDLMDVLMQVQLVEKKLDPVGKADADIDNDGDVDSSDEYLKNRRKKISKSVDGDVKKEESYGKMKKESKVVCPECKGEDDGCSHCDGKGYHMGEETMKETLATIRSEKLVASWGDFSEKYDEINFKGKKRPQDRPLGKSDEKPPSPGANKPKDMGGKGNSEFEKHTYGATPPEGMFDKESEKSKAFIKMHQKSDPEWENKEDEGHDDVSKAGRGVKKQSPDRGGDQLKNGDTNIVNPIK